MGAPKWRLTVECPQVGDLRTSPHTHRLALSLGLVARPYEPLADSRTGTHDPARPIPLQSNQRTQPNPRGGLTLCSALLDLDLRAGLFHLLLDGFGIGLAHAFLQRLRRAVDEVLGLLE